MGYWIIKVSGCWGQVLGFWYIGKTPYSLISRYGYVSILIEMLTTKSTPIQKMG